MHDQTEKQWLDERRFGGVGTCVCLLKEGGHKRLIPKVTYQECLKVAASEWLAFKWVPETVASYEELQESACNLGTLEGK